MRLVYADAIISFLRGQKVRETGAFSKGVNKGLNIAISAVKNAEIAPPKNRSCSGGAWAVGSGAKMDGGDDD